MVVTFMLLLYLRRCLVDYLQHSWLLLSAVLAAIQDCQDFKECNVTVGV